MRNLKKFALIAAFPGLVLAGAAQAGSTRAADQATAAGGGEVCRVRVERDGSAGTLDVSRQVLGNGDCVCIAKTGPNTQSASVEAALADLLRSRSCADAPAYVPGNSANAGGGIGTALWVVPAVAVVGLGVAVGGGGNNDSPGN